MRNFWKNLTQHTIARDLTIALILTIAIVFSITGAINYFYTLERDSEALYEKADEITNNLATVLITPLWNLNYEEIRKIIDVYKKSGVVHDISLVDDTQGIVIAQPPASSSSLFKMQRTIEYNAQAIGYLTVAFTKADIMAKQQDIATYSAIVFSCLIFALIVATTLLLRRFVSSPFSKLKDGLDIISKGNYEHTFEPVKQIDINSVTSKVMAMAREIANREAALEENRAKLEILNQAILDIFSCSDADNLIRTTLQLTYEVCSADQGWFCSKEDLNLSSEEEFNKLPNALVCLKGQIFTTTRQDIEPHINKNDNEYYFSFPLESRYRSIGKIVLAFENPPSSSLISLLKSLMSLANLAMIRQSFIRETAYMTAELQVAETMQRSMLPDEEKLPVNATFSYHYQPVLRVGGDWFNVIESADGENLYVILGDVTGHGLAQGLVTTAIAGAFNVLQSMIQDFGSDNLRHPSQIMTQLNNVICRIAYKSNLRMTCVVARVDFKHRQLSICNAGHTFPLILRQTPPDQVKLQSLAKLQQHLLGDLEYMHLHPTFQEAVYDFFEDDILIFFTDGLTEAADKNAKAFNRSFHRHLAKVATPRSAEQVRDDIIKLLHQHIGNAPVKDDICLLVLGKRKAEKIKNAS